MRHEGTDDPAKTMYLVMIIAAPASHTRRGAKAMVKSRARERESGPDRHSRHSMPLASHDSRQASGAARASSAPAHLQVGASYREEVDPPLEGDVARPRGSNPARTILNADARDCDRLMCMRAQWWATHFGGAEWARRMPMSSKYASDERAAATTMVATRMWMCRQHVSAATNCAAASGL